MLTSRERREENNSEGRNNRAQDLENLRVRFARRSGEEDMMACLIDDGTSKGRDVGDEGVERLIRGIKMSEVQRK